ncbi:hypothetical protein PHET_04546 [Paragonimus heterotremus]|uniref:Uncharacterized protein n=1 Tax=Paragonimus heterotremus TaxID=100268 RepID=A0A8J4TIN8_9TREM|nr:hypothetical protein PHET_04546 [Paragonimus heterotremus]
MNSVKLWFVLVVVLCNTSHGAPALKRLIVDYLTCKGVFVSDGLVMVSLQCLCQSTEQHVRDQFPNCTGMILGELESERPQRNAVRQVKLDCEDGEISEVEYFMVSPTRRYMARFTKCTPEECVVEVMNTIDEHAVLLVARRDEEFTVVGIRQSLGTDQIKFTRLRPYCDSLNPTYTM